jgi:3-methylfumaryl-CoA hydratase
MSEWDAWLGREEIRRDRVDEALLARWCATLDRPVPAEGLAPQGFHWCLCTPDAASADLGVDGHPRRDDSPQSFFPPVPLPRRMWASSKVEFIAPPRVGEAVTRTSRIASITAKSGASGSLVFVEVAHETAGSDGVAVREVQSLVYREPAPAGAPPAPPPLGTGRFDPAGWDMHRLIEPDPPLLFRFSALTFNTHRIHYDLAYATQEEGYRGLVVHGPLTATLLLGMAQQAGSGGAVKRFAFRALSPAIADEPLNLVLREDGGNIALAAFAADGRQTMSAEATRQEAV